MNCRAFASRIAVRAASLTRTVRVEGAPKYGTAAPRRSQRSDGASAGPTRSSDEGSALVASGVGARASSRGVASSGARGASPPRGLARAMTRDARPFGAGRDARTERRANRRRDAPSSAPRGARRGQRARESARHGRRARARRTSARRARECGRGRSRERNGEAGAAPITDAQNRANRSDPTHRVVQGHVRGRAQLGPPRPTRAGRFTDIFFSALSPNVITFGIASSPSPPPPSVTPPRRHGGSAQSRKSAAPSPLPHRSSSTR